MGAFIIYYIFLFLLIPAAIWFFLGCNMTDALKNLHGLSVEPHYNEMDNSVIVKNNFNMFYFDLKPLRKKSPSLRHVLKQIGNDITDAIRSEFPMRVLKQICTDIEEGKNYNGAWYLSLYKKYYTQFFTVIVLASCTAPLLAYITVSMAGYFDEYITLTIIAFQSGLFVLIGVLRIFLDRSYILFTEVFYKSWYDILLNFDAMRFLALKNNLSEKENLQNILTEIQTVYAVQSEALSRSNTELAAQIQKLADEKEKGNIVTIETVKDALGANLSRVEVLCANLETASKTLETSHKNLLGFSGKNKEALNAVNKMAGEFAALRNALLAHTTACETAAIEKLEALCAALETDVRKTWNSIDETLNRNARDLSASYEHFFELCKTLSAANKKKEKVNGK